MAHQSVMHISDMYFQPRPISFHPTNIKELGDELFLAYKPT
jgi:hypothetical protein